MRGTTTVRLPTLHADQARAYRLKEDARGGEWAANSGGRFKALRCGRRYGKSVFGETWLADGAIKGYPCGWFAPDYKKIAEVYQELYDIILPVKRSSSKTEGVIRTITGGRIDFWTLDNESAGRSRKYKRVFIDESGFTKPNMMDVWKRAIKPTLLDLKGSCITASNTNGVADDNFLWQVCNQPEHEFIEYHAPSWANPLIPERLPGELDGPYAERRAAEFASIKAREHPMVWRQEYEAEFVDWGGVAFFTMDKMLVDDQPVEYPRICDTVFAVIDSATKTGTANDATAVVYGAFSEHIGHKLTILDWDTVQIEGDLLISWLPNVLLNLEALAKKCGARRGSIGVFIEDKASGEILIKQAQRQGLPVQAIESRLTALGKDERALSVSGYHYQGLVKMSRQAYEKVVTLKNATRNHLVTQITGFRLGDKDAYKRADDLLDCFTYLVALALGDSGGI